MLSHGATERAAWGVGQQALGAGFALQLQQTHGGAGRFGAWFAQRTNAQIDKTARTTQLFDDRLAFLQIVFADVADHGVVVIWPFHIGLQRSWATGRCRWRRGGGGTASQQSSQGSGVDPGFHGGCSFKEGAEEWLQKEVLLFFDGAHLIRKPAEKRLVLRFYNDRMAQNFDVCIRGAGIVGRALALMLAQERLRVALVASAPTAAAAAQDDVRAYALNAASAQLLQGLRVWPQVDHVTAVRQMQVHGDGDSCVQFAAGAHDVDALAWIVEVPALEQRLAQAVSYQPLIEVVDAPVPAPLTAICEGRASRTRQELGVEFDVQPYAQTAIATRLRCEHAHEQIARQWFSPLGILALLPLGGAQGQDVAVVWSVPHNMAEQWLHADADDFVEMLDGLSHSALGRLQLQGARMAWPLQQATAQRWCGAWPIPVTQEGNTASAGSWVLVGDAAHNVHPLAGQGLNLGLADVATLAQLLAGRGEWRSTGDLRLLRRYERTRKAAMLPLGWVMDGIQQLFARPEGKVQMLRNWGMNQFERSGPIKQWAVRQAMGL